MIVATPANWFQSHYTLTDSGSDVPFGEIALRVFRGGRLTIGGDDYEIEATDWTQTSLALVRGGARMALARRPQVWRRRTEVVLDAALFEAGTEPATDLVLDLAPEGWLGKSWTVTADGLDAGRAEWSGAIKARLTTDLSDAVPLVAQAFVAVVLVVDRRNRRRN